MIITKTELPFGWPLRVFARLQNAFAQILILLILSYGLRVQAQSWKYPASQKVAVVDNYHGTEVADPYRWLEDAESEETQAWVAAQNELTFSYLENIPAREQIKKRLLELWNFPKYTVPVREGQRYFFSKNDGLQNQAVLYMQERWDGEARVVIDPNKLSADGTIALTNQVVSKDGKLLAYGLSSRGSDWQEIKIRNLDAGKDYDETLKWCRFTGIAWTHDHKGFYYSRFPEPGTVPKEDEINFNRVYYHLIGTSQSQDPLIYARPDFKELGFYPSITEDGKYLVLYVYHGTDPKNRIYYRELGRSGAFVKLLDDADANYTPIGNSGAIFYFHTDLNAPRGKIIAIDSRKPERENWQTIISEQANEVISSVTIVNNQFVAAYLRDAQHILKVFNLSGKIDRDISLPTIGTISALSGKRRDTEMFMQFTSFLFPATIYRYSFKDSKMEVFRDAKIKFDPLQYETKQVFYSSKDGTRVPMFITHKKGLPLSGDHPTLLYGYGGFNISLTPAFSTSRLVWLENGGVLAIPNLRGGGEYGEQWHQAGVLDRKQNVFDDFIAAAEWLIANGYTNSRRLAINGGSNGGLLVAACLVQRPDLFGAVICQVPVIDMLRYHKFTVGRYWVSDYGNAEKPEDFKFLYAYSPLHNVHAGVSYPPTLITTADTDDRVVPAHAKKFAAALQAAQAGDHPILIRVETKAGHGGGKPTAKLIDEASDIYAFLFNIFGMSMSQSLN
jgi:prolyl oligopeptidase